MAQGDNQTPVILVGRSPVEQTLRRDPNLEMVRAPGMLNAIGELASLSLESAGEPIVVFAGDAQQSTDLARCIESLRVVDARVRIVGVRARDNGSPAPPPSPHISCWIDDDATGDDLRASVALPEADVSGATEQPRIPLDAAPPAPTPAPTPAKEPEGAPDDDRAILGEVLKGRDPVEVSLSVLRARLVEPGINFVELDEPSGGGAVEVVHGTHRFGWLDGPASLRAALDTAAPWLASWIALARQQAQLRNAALTDPLTGAWNRRYFDRYLHLAIDRARARRNEVSLLLFDIDNFKKYNDRYGHGAGDEVLCETIRLLTSIVRPTDRVARIGGDEFAVIFDSPEGPRDPSSRQPLQLYDIAQRFQQRIRAHQFPKLGDEALGILSVSGGMATFPWDALDAESLVERSDELILSSKAQGKNLICFGPGTQRANDCPSQTPPNLGEDSGEK